MATKVEKDLLSVSDLDSAVRARKQITENSVPQRSKEIWPMSDQAALCAQRSALVFSPTNLLTKKKKKT